MKLARPRASKPRFVGLAKLFAISPEKGAETIIYLASSAAVTEMTGVYFYQRLPIIGYFLAVTCLCAKRCIMRANRKKGPAMSNHGTASSDATVIRVDRSTPIVYPHRMIIIETFRRGCSPRYRPTVSVRIALTFVAGSRQPMVR